MKTQTKAIQYGLWSSLVVLISGAGLVAGILTSSILLPTTLTTEWQGIGLYAQAYRARGGIITSLSFLAALVSCPAYVLQIASIQRIEHREAKARNRLGLASAIMFAALAGTNYIVQLSIVRDGILDGQTQGLAWLVFQNPDSIMLALDFVGWFFLGLAFLSVVSFFKVGRLNRAIRYLLITSSLAGVLLLAGLVTHNPAIGQVFLTMMSALLTCTDILLVVFFRRLFDCLTERFDGNQLEDLGDSRQDIDQVEIET